MFALAIRGRRRRDGQRTSAAAALVSGFLPAGPATGDRRLGCPGSGGCNVGGLALCPGWSQGHLVPSSPSLSLLTWCQADCQAVSSLPGQ